MKQVLLTAAVLTGFALAGQPEVEQLRERARRLRDGDTDGWRRVPWAASLTAAADAARREGRPMFVFTHDGNIDTGRC